MGVTMSVHEGLARLKMLNKKVYQTRTDTLNLMRVIKNNDKTIDGITLEEFATNAQSYVQSFEAMVENYNRLKSAIVLSNATTKVVISGKEYTVAEAIERKNYMEKTQYFKNMLFRHKEDVVYEQKRNEENFQSSFEKFLSSQGDAKNRKVEEIEVLRKFFEANNGSKIYDPCNLNKIVEKLDKEYDDFMTEVDYRLSESNATTMIDVEFV